MHEVPCDIESRSAINLLTAGAWRYAADATTEVLCVCLAVDDGEVQTWLPPWVTKQLGLPEQPVPDVFFAIAADPKEWRLIAHGEFERAMLECILVPRYGFPSIPLEAQHCSMTLALANGYPAELALLTQALELEFQKDLEGVRLMRTMSRPRKPRKGEDKTVLHWVFDAEKLQRLIQYCQQDVLATRAVWRHPRLRPLIEAERRLQILDAEINRRGVRADRELATAARDMAIRERARLNAAMSALTEGAINSIDQVERIRSLANSHGHRMETLGKRSVSAVLAGEPSDLVRQLLELRRDGARASTKKYQRILDSITKDDRLRGTMRMYGAGPGRWSGRGPQLQNLKKNESNIPLAAIEAVRSDDRECLRAFGNPLTVLGDIARAVVCAAPGHELIAADFGAIESRILAWLSNEQWKLQSYIDFDRSGDKTIEPYHIIAARMLHRDDVASINKEERNKGKAGDLACGFGGSVGAWRRIAGDDKRSDAEIQADVYAWRQAHPKTVAYWHELARAIRIAIRTGQPMAAGKITAGFNNRNLTLTLPSGRSITYPEARLTESKFENGYPDVTFKDNAHGKWADYRGWFGVFAENAVQGAARDLLAAAIERFETRGIHIVLTVHDEAVAEVPVGSISQADFLAILLEAPAWAAGLPLAGKVWSGSHYLEPPEEAPATTPAPTTTPEPEVQLAIELEAALDTIPAEKVEAAKSVEEDVLEGNLPPLFDLVSVPLTADRKTTCPFHPGDKTPSLQFYPDHYYCFGCGTRGGHLQWLIQGEGLTREESVALIRDWDGSVPLRRPPADPAAKLTRARDLWTQAGPIAGTIGERYLAQTRRIDVAELPANINDSLRFFASCPFGQGQFRPCLLALMRDPESDQPVGIQRIALELRNGRVCKVDRFALGRTGAVKLWPAGPRLVIGEGLETTLAAATRIPYQGAPLRPAWSAVSSGKLSVFPVLPGVERLIILVDHDGNGEGQAAAVRCMERWTRAGRTVVRLTPKRAGADFNDLVMPEPVS